MNRSIILTCVLFLLACQLAYAFEQYGKAPDEGEVTTARGGSPPSVLNIEYVKDMYGCTEGCLGYRYVNSQNADVAALFKTGSEADDGFIYSCRAYHDGDIIPGKYNAEKRQCIVVYLETEYIKTGDHVEVLTNLTSLVPFQWVKASGPPQGAIQVNRDGTRGTLYIIRCKVPNLNTTRWVPGHFQPDIGAFISNGGKGIKCDKNDIEFLVCRENKKDQQCLPNYITNDEFEAIRNATILPSKLETHGYTYIRHPKQGDTLKKWTNAIVPYTVDPAFTPGQRREIAMAIKHYEDTTCIQFFPKDTYHTTWLEIIYDPNVCSAAHWCMNEGAQFAKFGGNCVTAGNLVYELGHTLCMGHEESRSDREMWGIRVDSCADSFAALDNNPLFNSTRRVHKLYDYLSSQHSQEMCDNGCIIPTQNGVTKCGSGGPLSVLDIEYLNDMYRCLPGLHRYRFVDSKGFGHHAVVAGVEENDDSLYICRSYHDGNIIPGKYHAGRNECNVAYNEGEFGGDGDHVEVLHNSGWGAAATEWVESNVVPPVAFAGGRTKDGETLYLVQCLVNLEGRERLTPGYYQPSVGAFTSFGGKTIKCTDGNINFLV